MRTVLILTLVVAAAFGSQPAASAEKTLPPVGLWGVLEVQIAAGPADSRRRTLGTFVRPDGTSLVSEGFLHPDGTWRVRAAADQLGPWKISLSSADASRVETIQVSVERHRNAGGLRKVAPDSPWLEDEDGVVRPRRALEVDASVSSPNLALIERRRLLQRYSEWGYDLLWCNDQPSMDRFVTWEELIIEAERARLRLVLPRPADATLVHRWGPYRHVLWQDSPLLTQATRIPPSLSLEDTRRQYFQILFSGRLPVIPLTADHETIRAASSFADRLPLTRLHPREIDGRHALSDGSDVHYVLWGHDTAVRPLRLPGLGDAWRVAWTREEEPWRWTPGRPADPRSTVSAPDARTGWIARLQSPRSLAAAGLAAAVVADGNYPDLAVAPDGRVFLVYARDQALYCRIYSPTERSWGAEEDTSLRYRGTNEDGPHRGDPEVVVDRQGRPHVIVGRGYAWKESGRWQTIESGLHRDHALGLDSEGNLWGVRRGGNHDGHVGVQLRRKASGPWEPAARDADTGTPRGLAWRSPGDHPYGHLFTGPDGIVHLVYRQGAPEYIAYRWTRDLGATWQGGGVFGGGLWQPESPSGHVAADGTVWIIGPNGEVFRKVNEPSEFVMEGRAILGGSRVYPVLSSDAQGTLYAAAFGGEFNVRRPDGRWLGRRLLPSPNGQPLGYVALAPVPGTGRVYVAYESGQQLQREHLSTSGSILFATVDASGVVGETD